MRVHLCAHGGDGRSFVAVKSRPANIAPLTLRPRVDCSALLRQSKLIKSLCRGEQRQKAVGAEYPVLREKSRRDIHASVRVFVDFDGTISVGDTTDLILERFADPSWLGVEADWVAGRIGSRECLARQIDLIRATPEALDAFARGSVIDPHFAGFAALCATHRLPLTVVSDGLDRVATAMLARAGLRPPI